VTELVIFDCDGVLIDSDRISCTEYSPYTFTLGDRESETPRG
jgi:beta-phosphoglucomutase-like phosphatase (HAD superfamily)